MSGRRKGLRGEAEAADALRAFGLRVVPAQRDGETPDVDAFVRCGRIKWVPLQIKREEQVRPVEWAREYASRGVAVMFRRNRERWTLIVPPRPGSSLAEFVDVETFAAIVLGGAL